MTRLCFILCGLASVAPGAGTVIDRIVAVVGKRAIKQSDVERDLRVTQFLNSAQPDVSDRARKEALDRLIEQQLIRAEIGAAANTGNLDNQAKALFAQLLKERFGGSQARLDAELHRRGLTESQLLDQLQWQLIVLRFIEQRFRPGVIVTDEDVRNGAPKTRETLEAEAIDRNFEQWLAEARKAATIQYKGGVQP